MKEIIVEKVTETVSVALTEKALADAGIDLDDAASEEEVQAALASIETADVAGIAAEEAAAAPKEAWEGISQDDLAEATAYAAEFAAEEAAKIVAAEDITAQLDELISSGASEEEIAAFEAANPAPE